MLSQSIYFIIDRGVSAPGQVIEVVHCFNNIDKRFIFLLMSTAQLLGAKGYDTHMDMHATTCTFDISLAREFQKHLFSATHKHGIIYQGRHTKMAGKQKWTEREFHAQYYADVAHKHFKMFCNKPSFQNFHFVVHTQNHMVSEG